MTADIDTVLTELDTARRHLTQAITNLERDRNRWVSTCRVLAEEIIGGDHDRAVERAHQVLTAWQKGGRDDR